MNRFISLKVMKITNLPTDRLRLILFLDDRLGLTSVCGIGLKLSVSVSVSVAVTDCGNRLLLGGVISSLSGGGAVGSFVYLIYNKSQGIISVNQLN